MTYDIERLADHHERGPFASGDEPLDRYLKTQAGQDIRRRAAAVFVAVEADTTRVCGYYTLAAAQLDAGAISDAARGKLPRYPQFPAALVGRLAVDTAHGGQGLGKALVADAVARAVAVDTLPVMFVVVEAYEHRRGFYERQGFLPIPGDRRLFLPVSAIARYFGQRQ